MKRDAETTKQLISLALKEYDALRKGIDDRLDVTKTYGWPVVLLSFGAIAGLKSDLVSVSTALTFLPAVVFSIAALDANANHDKARTRRALATVEDRIFILSGEPAFCHESKVLIKCRDQGTKQLWQAVAYTTVYALVETIICLRLLQPKLESIDWTRTFLFFSVLAIPALLLLYSSYGTYKVYSAPLSTLLIKCIEESKDLKGDMTRLLYDTNHRQLTKQLTDRIAHADRNESRR
jgi:hypothetical protein